MKARANNKGFDYSVDLVTADIKIIAKFFYRREYVTYKRRRTNYPSYKNQDFNFPGKQTMYDAVKNYYGKELQSSSDLKTTACCDFLSIPAWLKPLLSNIHDEVLSRYYGCGLVCPTDLKGKRILDLGSGSGRDVYGRLFPARWP